MARMISTAGETTGNAAFSRCGRYRWWLRRRWRDRSPTLLFLGLNPSSADARRDDPTLRRLMCFADGWGYGALEVLNLFAWISAEPQHLRHCQDPVGALTDGWIARRVQALGGPAHGEGQRGEGGLPLWLGWGNGGDWLGRDRQLLGWLQGLPVRLLCLGMTARGQPRHPLYCRGDSPLLPFAPSLERRFAPSAAPCPARRAAMRSI